MLACTYSTQMEKVILSQAVILFSNQIFSTEIQSALVIQFLNPIFEYFSSEQFNAAISSPESFVKYVGLDDRNDAESISNRKKIFYYTNLLYGILKSINVQNCLANASNSFQLDSKSNTIGFNLGNKAYIFEFYSFYLKKKFTKITGNQTKFYKFFHRRFFL